MGDGVAAFGVTLVEDDLVVALVDGASAPEIVDTDAAGRRAGGVTDISAGGQARLAERRASWARQRQSWPRAGLQEPRASDVS
jgi:hypothetical protein